MSFRINLVGSKGVDALQLWFRQNIILAAASILEVYIISACTVAFSARPEIISRALFDIDGALFVKFPDATPPRFRRTIKQKAEDLTRGEWVGRIRKLDMEIGRVPETVRSLTSKLQELQDKRNRIAHNYGVEGELRKTPWEPISAITAENNEIIEFFNIVDSVSKSLDSNLFGPLIGGFELINEYHSWLSSLGPDLWIPNKRGRSAFQSHLGRAFGTTPGADYLRSMIEYYDSIQLPA